MLWEFLQKGTKGTKSRYQRLVLFGWNQVFFERLEWWLCRTRRIALNRKVPNKTVIAKLMIAAIPAARRAIAIPSGSPDASRKPRSASRAQMQPAMPKNVAKVAMNIAQIFLSMAGWRKVQVSGGAFSTINV